MAIQRFNKKKSNVSVKVHANENVDKAIRRFIRKCKKEGIVQQVRDRRYFKKPSQVRHERNARKKIENAKENKKRLEREKKMENYKFRPRRRYNKNGKPNRNNRRNNPNRNNTGPNRNNNQNRNNSNFKKGNNPNRNNNRNRQNNQRKVDPNSPFAKLKDIGLKKG